MIVTLAPALEKFVQQKVDEGAYASASEMIAASLAMLQTDGDSEWKSTARQKIEQGLRSARDGKLHDLVAVTSWMDEQKAAWRDQHGGR